MKPPQRAEKRPDRRRQNVVVVVLGVGHGRFPRVLVSLPLGVAGAQGRLRFGQVGFVEGIGQRDLARSYLASGSFTMAGSTIEADRHLHPFARLQHLLGKAETVDLGEEATRLIGGDVVGGGACHRAVGRVVGLIEGKAGFADPQRHLVAPRA